MASVPRRDITIPLGDTYVHELTVVDAESDAPVDLSGWTWAAVVVKSDESQIDFEVDDSFAAEGTVLFTLLDAQTSALEGLLGLSYRVQGTRTGDGVKWTPMWGQVRTDP